MSEEAKASAAAAADSPPPPPNSPHVDEDLTLLAHDDAILHPSNPKEAADNVTKESEKVTKESEKVTKESEKVTKDGAEADRRQDIVLTTVEGRSVNLLKQQKDVVLEKDGKKKLSDQPFAKQIASNFLNLTNNLNQIPIGWKVWLWVMQLLSIIWCHEVLNPVDCTSPAESSGLFTAAMNLIASFFMWFILWGVWFIRSAIVVNQILLSITIGNQINSVYRICISSAQQLIQSISPRIHASPHMH